VSKEADLPREARHEFVPFHRGPFSFTLAYDLKSLEAAGLLTQMKDQVVATSAGSLEAAKTSRSMASVISSVVGRHRDMNTSALVDHVYETYPWFTVNSKWTERRAYARPVADIAIYTTSYEGVQVDGLLNRLMKQGIQRLIDVRFNPVARRYGFHKTTLASLCPMVGIEYLHMPELGIPGAWRADLGSKDSYDSLFGRYAKEVLPEQHKVLKSLSSLIKMAPTALMCKEADPRCCHRTTLAHELATQTGLSVIDLGEESPRGLF
jgi:uncharacterized protein (DUF488 family)